MNSKRILLVDDSRQLLHLLEVVFKQAGWHVSVAQSVTSAIRVAEESQPQLILLDYELPDGTGADAAEALSHLPLVSAVPRILYSGRRTERLPDKSKGLFTAVVSKSASLLELPSRVLKVLEGQ